MPGSAKRKGSPTSAPATPPVKASKADASKEEVPEAASPSGGTLLGASDPDTADADPIYTITQAPARGTLYLDADGNSDLTEDQIVRAAYDNTMVNAIDVMTTTLTANPQYDNWIFYACNDDGVLGAARAMENSSYPAENGIGIGIDGSRACDAFGNGRASAYKGTMWLNSANHGRDAVQLLLASIKDGTALPEATYSDPEFITMDNFGEYQGKLCS